MSGHEQFADDLALYALGALDGPEREALEKHLATCVGCRGELKKLRGDTALLAFSAAGPAPPARSRERLMAAIAREPRRTSRIEQPRRAWWRPLEWAAAAAAVIVLVLLYRQNAELKTLLAGVESNLADQQAKIAHAQQLVASLTSRDAARFTLVASKTPPQPQGKAIYVRKSGTLMFLANDMPALPPQKTYELWLIPETGAPIPAGLFHPDASGGVTMMQSNLPAGVQAKTFAITVEPEAGSAAPTTQPLMVGVPG